MNKVITINLNGVAYQLEEGGYEALRAYLDNAARRLEGNPDKEEIIADIEQAIADKFRALLGAHKTVVITREVTAVIAEMGPVEDSTKEEPAADAGTRSAAEGAAKAGDGASAPPPVRRLYRIQEGAMLTGVCNGLGAYFGLDPTFIRIGFVVLTFFWGAGFLVYLLMSFVVPTANTPAERSAAAGMNAAATAQEFIRRAREGYYEGMKTWHDKEARRAWKRKFKREMHGWSYNFSQSMHDSAQQWQHQWQNQCQQPGIVPPPSIFGAVFLAPVLSLLLLALFLVCFYVIFKLVTTGSVLGLALPAGMPLWGGILLTVIVFQFIAWPIKSVRYACYYPGRYYGPCGPLGGLIGSLIGLFFLAFGIWMLDRHVPEFHEWLVQLPTMLQHLGDTVRAWWTKG